MRDEELFWLQFELNVCLVHVSTELNPLSNLLRSAFV